ncbi:MAG: hypothetical protein ABSG32_25525 [Terriglobia bacterium]|jgi:hypothetical protein
MSEFRRGNKQETWPLPAESFPHVQDATVRAEAGIDLDTLNYEFHDRDRAIDALRALGPAGSDAPAAIYLAYRAYSDLAAQQLSRLAEVSPESAQMHLIRARAPG